MPDYRIKEIILERDNKNYVSLNLDEAKELFNQLYELFMDDLGPIITTTPKERNVYPYPFPAYWIDESTVKYYFNHSLALFYSVEPI